MKIAITEENGQVFQHFGQTKSFRIYEIEDGKILASNTVSTDGSGHCAIAGVLKAMGVDTLICGGIGKGAMDALREAGINIYCGVSGDVDKAVEQLLAGELQYNPNSICEGHGQHHGNSCGQHRYQAHH